MAKILVLYYSMYGHMEAMADAVAAGASECGAEVDIKRVPEIISEDIARAAGAKMDQQAPIAQPQDLAAYDAILFGTPTRFGNMTAQMRGFLDQTGGLWMGGHLAGKVGSVFTSGGDGVGQDAATSAFLATLLHHGMIVAGLPYSTADVGDGADRQPCGASRVAANDRSPQPSARELKLARDRGAHVAEVAAKLGMSRHPDTESETTQEPVWPAGWS